MKQVRIHGRGGQGVVTAAELIALAAFFSGKEAQAFPFFGVERSGAPIMAFARISDQEIKTREQVYCPDFLIIQDDSLITDINILTGVTKDTKIIINSSQSKSELFVKLKATAKKYKKTCSITENNIISAPATQVALEIIGKNLINTVMLGVLAREESLFALKHALAAVKEKFSDKSSDIIKKNLKAILSIYANK